MFILGSVIGAIVGFIFGVLFGRRNTQKVEKAVTEGKKVIAEVEAKVK